MADMKKLIEKSNRYLMSTYKRFPIVLRKGRGCRVYDTNGKEYLDFVAGIAVNVLGHSHPAVVVAVQKQAQRLIHVSNLYHIEPQIRLAELLVENSFADRAFFCNSGAEANEAAIKLVRKYSHDHFGPDRHEIITALNSFHGRTMATLTATGQEKFHKGFEPLLEGFRYIPFDDLEALEKAITPQTAAVMLEPIQGEGGVRVPSPDYLKRVRELCDRNELLLVLDEVQTGIGRTGRLFAYEHFGIEPDIITLAKGLGGGVPIGAMLAREEVAKSFVPGTHASTFGGNPLAAQAALATLEKVLEDGLLLEECKEKGEYFMERLRELQKEHEDIVLDVRGLGLMIGLELARECTPVVEEALERGFLLNCAAGNTLRFTPPLLVTEGEIDRLIDLLHDIFGRLS